MIRLMDRKCLGEWAGNLWLDTSGDHCAGHSLHSCPVHCRVCCAPTTPHPGFGGSPTSILLTTILRHCSLGQSL